MIDARVIDRKLDRMAKGSPPRVLDLFAGCGGLTLGFHAAGCECLGGVELDADAARSHALNFHGHLPAARQRVNARARDITQLDPFKLLAEFGHRAPRATVDLLVGGPPCPAFTRVGRAKLREVHQHPEAFKHDPRAQLYLPYLRFVEALAPVALLMENVPDILNYGGHNLAEEIADVLEGLGYVCAYTLLNAANYGVPQMRDRFIMIAVHRRAPHAFAFPEPTHHVVLPVGYEGSRQVALKYLCGGDAMVEPRARYVPSPAVPADAQPAITVKEALDDLPPITGHLDGTIKRGARRFNVAVTYRPDRKPSAYARSMREWPGFAGDGRIWDHVIRSLSDRDYRLFRLLRPGDDYPRAHALAEVLFEAELARLKRTDEAPRPGTEAHRRLRAAYVPPYDAGKFPNKWRKIEADLPARTLMAHLGKDSYSHIHYDSAQARVISVREAARLQSFPDGFRFCGTMNPALRQIGNAVPPLFARALAMAMLASLGLSATAPAVGAGSAKARTAGKTKVTRRSRGTDEPRPAVG